LLNNYANFLSLDADPLLEQFASALQTRRESHESANHDAQNKKPQIRKPRAAGLRNFFTIDLLVGVFLIIVLFGFIIGVPANYSMPESPPSRLMPPQFPKC